MNIKLSKRDLLLLESLYANVFLSFYQIRDLHFKGLAKPTVYNRLSKLIKAGFVKTSRVNLRAYHKENSDVGVIYQITKKGLNMIRLCSSGKTFKAEPMPVNTSSLYHDLALTDVIKAFEGGLRCQSVVNTKVTPSSRFGDSRIPDAIITASKPDSNLKSSWALELELTAKSEKRYRDIILNYKLNDYEKIIYVVLNDGIAKKVGASVSGFGHNHKLGDSTGKFYFVKLADLFTGEATITNGKENIFINPQTIKESD